MLSLSFARPFGSCHLPLGRFTAPGMCDFRKSLGKRTSTTTTSSLRSRMPVSSWAPVVKATLAWKKSFAFWMS